MSMIRHLTTLSLAAVLCVAVAAPASAQRRAQSEATARVTAPPQAELRGTVQDDRGEPLLGAVESALGSSPAFAVSDSEGRFAFRNLSASRSTSAPGTWVAERVEFQGRRGGGGAAEATEAGAEASASWTAASRSNRASGSSRAHSSSATHRRLSRWSTLWPPGHSRRPPTSASSGKAITS